MGGTGGRLGPPGVPLAVAQNSNIPLVPTPSTGESKPSPVPPSRVLLVANQGIVTVTSTPLYQISPTCLRDRVGIGCGLVVVLFFTSMFACWSLWSLSLLAQHLTAWCETLNWVEVPATIQQVGLDVTQSSSTDGGSSEFKAAATYRYRFQGQDHTGTRVWLLTEADGLRSFHQRVKRELSASQKSGQPFHCYVDPDAPTQSLLYRDFRWNWVLFMAGLVVIPGLIGFGIPAALYAAYRRHHAITTRAEQFPHQPWLWNPDRASGKIAPDRKSTVAWIVFVAFSLLASPMAIDMLCSDEDLEGVERVFFLLLPAINLLAGVDVMRHAWRWRRYGRPVLQVVKNPLRVGQPATLQVCWPHVPHPEMELIARLHVHPNAEDAAQLFQAETHSLLGSDGVWTWSLNLPNDLPPTAVPLLKVASHERKPARWTLELREQRSWIKSWISYEASYQLDVYDQPSPLDRSAAGGRV